MAEYKQPLFSNRDHPVIGSKELPVWFDAQVLGYPVIERHAAFISLPRIGIVFAPKMLFGVFFFFSDFYGTIQFIRLTKPSYNGMASFFLFF